MRHLRRVASLCAGALVAASGLAQDPGQVLVVVNRNSPASTEIAGYYAAKRKIPAANMCLITTTVEEKIPRAVYQAQIERPVAQCLERKKLRERVNYLVTTLGVPLHISGPVGRDSPAASVDSELTVLYLRAQGKALPIAGPLRNPFYRQRDSPFSHRLFPIYLVTRLAAYDTATVKRMIDRGLQAKNRGIVVLDMREGSEEDGESWLRNGLIFLPNGRAKLEQTREPLYGEKNVIGYASWGSNDKRRDRRFPGFQWLPGAIATDFVSTNGRTFRRPPDDWQPGSRWEGTKQSIAADYLTEGAAGATGHTDEPYLGYCPRPDILFPAYLSGRNLAESFYLSIPAVSWMNIVVGDPLMSLGPP